MGSLATYTTAQWFFFFYVYCFIGWIWESGFVSAKSHQLVNRGFMHGPFLPIYGSGAIVILISTIGVKDNLYLVFLFGMISSTILEYFTGAAMEKLFQVRYWDYSKHKFNLKGHICLQVSLGWGLFSILMVKVIQPLVENLVLQIPNTIVDILSFALTIIVCVDMTVSWNEAMDLKSTLIKLAESNEGLRLLKEKTDFVIAIAEEEASQRKETFEKKKMSAKETLAANLEEARLKKVETLEGISSRIEELKASKPEEFITEQRMKLAELKEKMLQRTDRDYSRASRILKRNPGTVSGKHSD